MKLHGLVPSRDERRPLWTSPPPRAQIEHLRRISAPTRSIHGTSHPENQRKLHSHRLRMAASRRPGYSCIYHSALPFRRPVDALMQGRGYRSPWLTLSREAARYKLRRLSALSMSIATPSLFRGICFSFLCRGPGVAREIRDLVLMSRPYF